MASMDTPVRQRITRDQAMKYEFDHRHAPLLRVEQGESFVAETEDAGSGQVRSGLPSPSTDGPVYKEVRAWEEQP